MRAHVAILALALLGSCAHRSTHHATSAHQEEASSATSVVSVVAKQQQTATDTKVRTKKRTRTVVKAPDGTVTDTTVDEDTSTEQESRFDSVVAGSSSRSVVARNQSSGSASMKDMSESKPAGFSLPWWAYLLCLLALVALVVKVTGWRPWRRP